MYHSNPYGIVIGAGRLGTLLAIRSNSLLIPYRSLSVDSQTIDQLIKSYRPSYIICAFALTDLSFCQKNKDLAIKINSSDPSFIAERASHYGIYSLYLSSDYARNPLNIYGITKRLGERASFSSILRFNYFSRSHWLSNAISNRKNVKALSTNRFNPVHISTVVDACITLIDSRLAGRYSIGISTPISYYDLAIKLCEFFRVPISLVSKSCYIRTPYPYQYSSYIPPNLPVDKLRFLALNDEINKL